MRVTKAQTGHIGSTGDHCVHCFCSTDTAGNPVCHKCGVKLHPWLNIEMMEAA